MYNEILIPTDGSYASMAAVDQGVSIAEQFESHVQVLHVVDVGTEMSASEVGTIADELTETLDEMASDALDEAAVTYDREILEGIPHEAIEEYSVDQNVDIVVMGASGQSGIKEHLLGSTTDRVVQSVDVSVLVTRFQ